MSLLLEPLRVCPVCDRAEPVAITLDGRRAVARCSCGALVTPHPNPAASRRREAA